MTDSINTLREILPTIEVIYGLPKAEHVFHPLSKLIILDDLAEFLGKDSFVNEIFIRHSHHENASIIFTTQVNFNITINLYG